MLCYVTRKARGVRATPHTTLVPHPVPQAWPSPLPAAELAGGVGACDRVDLQTIKSQKRAFQTTACANMKTVDSTHSLRALIVWKLAPSDVRIWAPVRP
jgi:hypothetical protein